MQIIGRMTSSCLPPGFALRGKMKRDLLDGHAKTGDLTRAVELRFFSRLEVVAAGEPISENPSSGSAQMAAL
jgi:hypothetical protein